MKPNQLKTARESTGESQTVFAARIARATSARPESARIMLNQYESGKRDLSPLMATLLRGLLKDAGADLQALSRD